MTDFARIDRAMERNNEIWGGIFTIAAIAAFLTSIINCLLTGRWILLVIDLFVAPIGVLHGVMVWFGVG